MGNLVQASKKYIKLQEERIKIKDHKVNIDWS